MGNNMDQKIESWIKTFFSLFKKEISDRTANSILQFIKFGVVGLSNTIISYLINVLILLGMRTLQIEWDYIVANVVAFVLSVLWSFYWNNRFVFRVGEGEERSIGKALLKTYVAYGFTGIILNNLLSWFWITVMGISKFIAPLINLIVSVPLNFVINKLWAFKTEK